MRPFDGRNKHFSGPEKILEEAIDEGKPKMFS